MTTKRILTSATEKIPFTWLLNAEDAHSSMANLSGTKTPCNKEFDSFMTCMRRHQHPISCKHRFFELKD